MPMGILQDVDYECTRKRLEEGDYIVMVSDGVMDALPQMDAEEMIKDYLLQSETENAKRTCQIPAELCIAVGRAAGKEMI